MKNKLSLAESAKNVDAAHAKVTNTRRNLKSKRTMFMSAQISNQEAESELVKAKEAHDQQLIEKV